MVSETGRLIRAGLSRVGHVLRRRAAPGPVRSSCRRFYTILRDGRPRQAQETRYQAYEGGDQDMCRWIAYSGHTIALERYVTEPAHSLVSQSIAALESTAAINGDGFGLGWYGDHPEPGRYREVQPAWSDENLRYLCRHLHSHLFFAHVRAATGTPITRSNCHPFACGPWLFMHNGYLGDWARLRRPIEALIPDELYASRSGTTDSEAMFLALLGCGLMGSAPRRDPLAATASALAAMTDLAGGEGGVPLRFTAALSDGKDLYAFRYAANDDANSLYYQASGNGVVIVSEPLDGQRGNWIAVPENHAVVALKGSPVEVVPLDRYGLGAGISPLRKRTRLRA